MDCQSKSCLARLFDEAHPQEHCGEMCRGRAPRGPSAVQDHGCTASEKERLGNGVVAVVVFVVVVVDVVLLPVQNPVM